MIVFLCIILSVWHSKEKLLEDSWLAKLKNNKKNTSPGNGAAHRPTHNLPSMCCWQFVWHNPAADLQYLAMSH